tara:strand:- start:501 stop:1370 length:870 start_codon:yes stop_codon:yes gene_type:complete
MKPETFRASIEKRTNKLYISSAREIVPKQNAFVQIGDNGIFYKVESWEAFNVRRPFSFDKGKLFIKGNFDYRLSSDDVVTIYFKEYEALSITQIKHHERKYEKGEKLYAKGGILSNSSSNLTGEYTEITVTELDENENIASAQITKPGKYIEFPPNPVDFLNLDGEAVEVDMEYDLSSSSTILERNIDGVNGSPQKTFLNLSYPLPVGVKEGELVCEKQIVLLDKEYSYDSIESEVCQMTFDFTPINGIPLLPPKSINPHATYNEGVSVIDKRLQEIEKRLSRLENMNF